MGLLIVLPSEWAILHKRRLSDSEENEPIMHAIDSDVFNYCCSKMDWQTGDIGRKSALSYARLASSLTEEIPRKPTRHLRTVTAKMVENSVNRLVKAGLFLRESTSGLQQNRLLLSRVFWLELLTAPDSLTNSDGRQLGAITAALFSDKSFNNSNLDENSASSREAKLLAGGTYSNNYISNTPARERTVVMTLDWQPDRAFVDAFLQVSGFSGKHVKKLWFGTYVQYWTLQDVRKTKREWSAHFAKHMQGYLINPGRFEHLNGMGKDVGGMILSA